MKKNIRYKPSKVQARMGLVVGIIFVCIGLFVVIPSFGLFGLLWTGIAIFGTVIDAKVVFGSEEETKDYFGGYVIDEETEEASPEERLKKLQSLYDQRLITTEEYEEKRKEIVDQL